MRPILLSLLLCLFAACGEPGDPQPTDGPVTDARVDDLGRKVAVPDAPRRVFPMAPNVTEIVDAAGGRDRIAAIGISDNFPPELVDLPRIQTYPLGLESIVALEPDLLLANAEVNRRDDAERLADLGIPTYFFQFRSLDDVTRAIQTTGRLLGTADIADAAAAWFAERLEAVRQAAGDDDRPRVLLLIGAETLYAFGGASFTQELIAIAGGESITRELRGEGVTLSAEFIVDADPDVIIGAWGDEEREEAALLAHHPALRSLTAAREDRVFAIDPDLVVRAGPRLADAAEELATLIAQARR